jgi:hypothetical protein
VRAGVGNQNRTKIQEAINAFNQQMVRPDTMAAHTSPGFCPLPSQSTTTSPRTLSGIATDQTDARIPGAALPRGKNEASGDKRDSKTDNQGSSP